MKHPNLHAYKAYWNIKNRSDLSLGDFSVLHIFLQILICRGQHQLDTVQLVYLAGTRIVVDRYDIGSRITVTQLLDDTFSDNVVWQAGKRLCADDVRGSGVDQL